MSTPNGPTDLCHDPKITRATEKDTETPCTSTAAQRHMNYIRIHKALCQENPKKKAAGELRR